MLILGVRKSVKVYYTDSCSSTSYLIGGGSIAGRVCSQVCELLLQLVV